MRLRILPALILLSLVASAAGVSAQTPGGGRTGPAIGLDRLLGEAPSSPLLRLGRGPLPASFGITRPRWAVAADPLLGPFAPDWSVRAGRALADRPLSELLRAGPWGVSSGVSTALAADTARDEDTPAEGRVFRDLELPGVVQDLADLGLRVEGRGGLGGAWSRYRPCDVAVDLNCNPDLMPRLKPDVQFGIQVGGTITDRIHVEVDYDQRREFDAANNINIYYEGAPGEVLQRMEMGDVSIDLPASRYLTEGVPAGNFGFKTSARFGALDVEALWAQQKGDIATREFRLGGGGQAGLVQDQELVLDDADYAAGQFFFLVDPRELVSWPHVDVLRLDPSAAPAAVRPRADRLAVYRDEGPSLQRHTDQAQSGTFLADAVTADGELRHSGLFNLLEPGQDYYIHSSGLWIVLRAPLRSDEALAVAYRTETGVDVGDPEAEATPPGETPELLLVRGPVTIHQPGQPTWPWEMHQVYRLDSSTDVEASSLELTISLGHLAGGATFKQHAGRSIPLLRLFGLDDAAPADAVDPSRLFRPGADREDMGPNRIRGTFVVFPTLEPFGRPPPVPSEGLSAAQSAAVLGSDANPAIYDEPDPVVRSSSSRFRLNFRYRVRLEGVPSSFNLGAFGIRDGSERITVDDQLLVRGVDYVIDYDVGLVTLLDPDVTLGRNPDAEIRASWEQRALFDVAPTTVFGLNAAAPLGRYGDLNFIGMYQSEQSVVRRPQLGTAPASVLLGGASGRMAFQADWLSAALRAVPGLTVDSVARLDVSGEVAMSVAEPNRAGATYLDDFEATDELPLSLDAAEWQLGSAPQDAAGFPMNAWPLGVDNAAELVWQDRYRVGDEEVGFLRPDQIDEEIAVAGARLAEPVLYLTMGGGSATAPEWRSLTTVLSTTGQDLSRSEFFEFYAAPLSGPTGAAMLVIDVGTVGEDAFYVDSTGAVDGVDRFGRPWGRGVLDTEARLQLRETWGPENDRRGLWDQNCQAERLSAVPLGDDRANCTVMNGRPDSEDLNGNGVLDPVDGPSFRYVIPLSTNSPYLVRGETETGGAFRLFRVPLRGGDGMPLAGASEATWRFIKHIRITVVKPTQGEGTLALARMRITGSRWAKRDVSGVVAGRTDAGLGTGSATATVRVGSVSRLTDGDVYASPPGVQDEVQDPKSAIGPTGVEFNEKSLRLSWQALPSDERAEVYFRYPQQPRNFLQYRRIRFWAVPRSGSWGEAGDHELLFKLGTDPRNYYVYRTPLNGVGGAGQVQPEDWLPEQRVNVEEWLALKAEAERRLAEDGSMGPLVLWSADGRHGIVLEDRARAPNLAAVRELSLAVYNAGGLETDGEVWINDIRLDASSSAPGLAGRLNAELNAGGVFQGAVTVGGRGGHFQQLAGSPSWETVNELAVNTTTQLGRFLPQSWGVAMPVRVSYARTGNDPIFLQGTDIRADELPGLRDARSTRRRVGASLRKTTPSSNPLVSALVDGTVLRAGHVRSSDATVTTASRLDGFDGGVEVDRRVADVGFGVVPGVVARLLRWLAPRAVEQSDFFDRVTGARLRVTPDRVGFTASYVSQDARVWRYERVLESPRDLDVRPIESPLRVLESGARVSLRPLESLTARFDVSSIRDVLEPERATGFDDARQALRRESTDVYGVPLGWERNRTLRTDAAFRPVIADWLRPSVTWTSRFTHDRDPAHVTHVPMGDSAVAALQRTFTSDRQLSRSVLVDPGGAFGAALAPSGSPGFISGAVLAVVRPVKPVELTWTDGLGSRFDRDLAEPGLEYQVGWGRLQDFRRIGADTAVSAIRSNGFRARSGIRLGGSAAVDVGYRDGDTRVYDLRAGRRTHLERSWPDVRFSWNDIPLPDWIDPAIERWSVSTGFLRTERSTRLGVDVPRIRSSTERTVPVELRLAFAAGLSLSYVGSITRGQGRDPTGFTRQSGMSHTVGLSGRFHAPRAFQTALPEPVRVSFNYDYQEQLQSRVVASLVENTPPTPFIDHINRRLSLTVTSLVSRVDLGLQASYVDRRSFIGTQAGASQLQVSLFGQFNVVAGEMPI